MTTTLLDRYQLVRLIGEGGMAQVWEGRDDVLQRTVAVKTVDLSGGTDSTLGERLRREAVATAALAHPDIVTVHDAGVQGDTAFFVMELLAGRDVASLLRDGPLPVHEVARIGSRVTGALAAAHQAGIVHRDIKPGNVVVQDDQVTVVDFGIATIARAAQAMTAPGTVLGTPQYISPEQVQGRPATPASDMYSTGCLLMAMATGSGPFAGDDPLVVLHQHVGQEPPRLAERRPDVPPELDELVARLLDKDPARRPTAAQAHEVLRDLATAAPVAGATSATSATTVAMTTAPTLAMPVGAVEEPPRRARRLPLVLAALAVPVVAAIAISLGGDQEPTAGADSAAPAAAEEPEQAPAEQEPAPPADDVPGLIGTLDVDEGTRAELLAGYQEVAEAAGTGSTKKLDEALSDLDERIDELVEDGALAPADADALRVALVAAHGDLPQDGGDGDKPGKGKGRDEDD